MAFVAIQGHGGSGAARPPGAMGEHGPALGVVHGLEDLAELGLVAEPVARHRQVHEADVEPLAQGVLGVDLGAGPLEVHDRAQAEPLDGGGELVGLKLAAAVKRPVLDHVPVVPNDGASS